MRFVCVALTILLTLGFTAAAEPPSGLPAGLTDLWEGGDRCGEPTAEQWALTFEMGYPLAAEVASEAKVIPYRFILEDLVEAVQAQTASQHPAASTGRRAVRGKVGFGNPANVFGFTGHEMDRETGLIYMKGRFYDPETATFLTPDPFEGILAEPPSLHPYLYAYANPTVYVDPDGRCVGKLQQTAICQAIARGLEWFIAGNPEAEVALEIERREKVVQGRREFREEMGRDPQPDEVVWIEAGRAITSGFEEIDTSGRIEPDHAEWVVVGGAIGVRMAVGAARAAGATTAEQLLAGVTQLGDEAVGELTGLSPRDAADLARLAKRPWAPPTPTPSGSSGAVIITESGSRPGVELTPLGPTGGTRTSPNLTDVRSSPGGTGPYWESRSAQAHDPSVFRGALRPQSRAPEFPGGQVSESTFVDSALDYLGPGYREVSPGRYVSADGLRQVRFGAHEVRGSQLHGHFEAFDGPYGEGGRVIENTVVRITPDEVQ